MVRSKTATADPLGRPGIGLQIQPHVAALFVESAGIYSALPGVDPWPVERDARQYSGPYPVIAHPPCARWGNYATHYGHRLGDDAGCGHAAIAAVRKWGGVLEHPAWSWLFAAGYMPSPGLPDLWGGRTIAIEQADYGHPSLKPTWLYICGECELAIGQHRRDELVSVEHLSRKQRLATPLALAVALVNATRQIAAGKRGAA